MGMALLKDSLASASVLAAGSSAGAWGLASCTWMFPPLAVASSTGTPPFSATVGIWMSCLPTSPRGAFILNLKVTKPGAVIEIW